MCCFRATTSVFFHYLYYLFWSSLATWSAVLKGRLYSTRKLVKSSSAFTTFLFKFTVTELAQNWLIFFVAVQHLHIAYALKCLFVYWYHFLLHVPHHTEIASTHSIWSKTRISEWIWIYKHHRLLSFTQYFFVFDGAGSELSAIFFPMFWFYSWHQFYVVISVSYMSFWKF